MIVFDVGNTDTVVGIYENDNLKETLRIKSLKSESSVFFEYRLLNFMLEKNINKEEIKHAAISSVVPILTPFFKNFCTKFLNIEPFLVEPAKSNLLKINIDMPDELGSDLFVNALAASSLYSDNCIIVDFGTALTFTTVSSERVILGVTILPGIRTAIKSLFSQTSLLPEVRLEQPLSIIGKNSMQSIQAGVVYGYAYMVEGVIDKIKSELSGNVKVIATGGLSSILKLREGVFDLVDKNLTINGLYEFGKAQI